MGDAAGQFVSEPIVPDPASIDTRFMARGEAGLPMRFRWRERDYAVTRLLDHWKESGDSKEGPGERYLRKHWFRVAVDSGEVMDIYCDRQARVAGKPKARWWLYVVRKGGEV